MTLRDEEQDKVKFTLYIPVWLWEDVKILTVKKRIKINPLIRQLLFEWVQAQKQKNLDEVRKDKGIDRSVEGAEGDKLLIE
jgi:hypothetical protein